MKRRELERRLRKLGWFFLRHGGKHDIWTNSHSLEAYEQPIPRHSELNERLARAILKKAQENPGQDGH